MAQSITIASMTPIPLSAQSTSYEPSHILNSDDDDQISDCDESEILIARPARLFTTNAAKGIQRPHKAFHLPMPKIEPPTDIMTPPASPQRSQENSRAAEPIKTESPAPSFAERMTPLVSRANSLMSRSRPNLSSFRRDSSDKSASPTRSMTSRLSNMSNFSGLFNANGSSAPIALGLSLSPRKEVCDDTTFGGDAPTRPNHTRRGSSFSTSAANLLGFPLRSPNRSPMRRRRIIEEDDNEDEDHMMKLDLERELFPSGIPDHSLVPSDAYDELISNASRLFLKMQTAYREKHDQLNKARVSSRFEQEELEEAKERAKHLKYQLDGMSERVEDGESEVERLRKELREERHRRKAEEGLRMGSVRVVDGTHEEVMINVYDAERPAVSRDGSESEADSVWSAAPSLSTLSDHSKDGRGWGNANAASVRPGYVNLAEENQMLKARIAELEETVNGCLGLVEGL